MVWSLLGEITPRSLDYLLSFGEKLSIKIDFCCNMLISGKKSVATSLEKILELLLTQILENQNH